MTYSPLDDAVRNEDAFLLKLIKEANPSFDFQVKLEGLVFSDVRLNSNRTKSRPYNTLVNIYGLEKYDLTGEIIFNYNRYNFAEQLMGDEHSFGLPEFPYMVEGVYQREGLEALVQRFKEHTPYGKLIDEIELITQHEDTVELEILYHPVECIFKIKKDNRVCFTMINGEQIESFKAYLAFADYDKSVVASDGEEPARLAFDYVLRDPTNEDELEDTLEGLEDE